MSVVCRTEILSEHSVRVPPHAIAPPVQNETSDKTGSNGRSIDGGRVFGLGGALPPEVPWGSQIEPGISGPVNDR